MTLASATNRNDYTGNGAVDTYSYTFRIFNQEDLLVTVRNTSDVETTLTLITHYTVTGVNATAGGTVVLVNGAFDWIDADGDLKSGYHLTIRRVVDLQQETDIRNLGDFYPESHEDQFDYMTMIDQQQQDEIDRSVKLPETVAAAGFDMTLPTDIEDAANKVLAVNADSDGFQLGPTIATIESAGTSASAASASATAAANSATSASNSATAAAASATLAEDAAASIFFRDAVFKTFADSPINVVEADRGKLFVTDCTGGNVVYNLPEISGISLVSPCVISVKKLDTSPNTITLNRAGTDTIDGATSKTLSIPGSGTTLIPDTDPSPDKWTAMDTLPATGNFGAAHVTTTGNLSGTNVTATGVASFGSANASNVSHGFYKDVDAGDTTTGVYMNVGNSGADQGLLRMGYINAATTGGPTGVMEFIPRNNADNASYTAGKLEFAKISASNASSFSIHLHNGTAAYQAASYSLNGSIPTLTFNAGASITDQPFDITQGATDQALRLSGSGNVSGGAIVLNASSHATLANVVQFFNNGAESGRFAANGVFSAKATNSDDVAAAGYIGEEQVAEVTTPTNWPSATGVWGNLASKAVNGGHWVAEVSMTGMPNGFTSSSNNFSVAVSQHSGNTTTDHVKGKNELSGPVFATTDRSLSFSIPIYLAAPATIYLKGLVGFSAGTPQYQCYMVLRRPR